MRKESFEEKLRKSYDSFEPSTSAEGWSAIESGLGKSAAGKFLFSSGLKWTMGIGLVLGILGFSIWTSNQTSNSNQNPTANTSSESQAIDASAQVNESKNETAHSSADLNPVVSSSTENHPVQTVAQTIVKANSNLENQKTAKSSFEITPSDASASNNSISKEKNESNILSSVRQTCAGTEVSFKPQNSPSDGSYLWNFGDGAFSNESNPKHRFQKPGTYEVSLSVTDNKNAQINTVNMSETITILPNPNADFDWKFVNGGKEAPTVEIKNQSTNFVSASWKFGDGTESSTTHPIKTFSTKGSHSVVVTAINEYGCKDQKVKYINVNSDYNLNAAGYVNCGDGFMPEGLTQLKGKFSLSIYDGSKKIFETRDAKNPWVCTDMNGNKVEVNKQYPWIAILHDAKTGEDRYYSGAVLVKP